MTTHQAKKKREIAKEKLDIIAEWLSSELLDDEHKQIVEDFKWSVLGYFDAEISHAENMLQLEQNFNAMRKDF